METQTNELLATAQWIEHIERNLPTEARSRRIMAKVIILLTSIRHLPNFEMFPITILPDLDTISWPNPGMMFKLGEIIGCFGDFDETAIEEIKAAMQKILDETASSDTLKAYLARELNAKCTDNYHAFKPSAGTPLLLVTLATTLTLSIDALEDFSVTMTTILSDGDIQKCIGAYFASRGYRVYYVPGFVFAEKDNLRLSTHFTNYTASRNKILVTVKEV